MKNSGLKKIQLLLLTFSILGKCYGQKNDRSVDYFSTEPFVNYPYYHFQLTPDNRYVTKLNYNYGEGIFLAINQNRMQFKTGIWHSTKEYYTNPSYLGNTIDRIDYNLDYINIPLLLGVRLNEMQAKKNAIVLTTGIIFTNAYDFNSVTKYNNGTIVTKNLNFQSRTGISARFGLRYQYNFTENWSFFIDGYTDFKITKEYNEYVAGLGSGAGFVPSTYNLPDDRLLFGTNIGIAYCFGNQGRLLKKMQSAKPKDNP